MPERRRLMPFSVQSQRTAIFLCTWNLQVLTRRAIGSRTSHRMRCSRRRVGAEGTLLEVGTVLFRVAGHTGRNSNKSQILQSLPHVTHLFTFTFT